MPFDQVHQARQVAIVAIDADSKIVQNPAAVLPSLLSLETAETHFETFLAEDLYAEGQAARWLRPPYEYPLPDPLRLLEYLVDACEA